MLRSFIFSLWVVITPLFTQTAFAQSWTKLATTDNPPERLNHSAVYDPLANRMVIFGGKVKTSTTTESISNDLWSLDLTTLQWAEIIPAGLPKPAPRFTHNAIFDSASNRMVVWSGQGVGGQFYNDVWAFNFSNNAWEELWTNGNTPGVPNQRYGATAQFDLNERRLIAVSGFTTAGRFADTWAFHTDSLLWSDKTNATMSLHPPKRCLHSSCFSEDRRALYLYGGQTDGGISYLDDLWILNVDTFEWVPHLLPGRPTGRHFTSIAYDGTKNLYVFGGQTAPGVLNELGVSNELWRLSLDGNIWEQLLPAGSIPAQRFGHTAITVPARNSMLVFGGMLQNNVRFNETWELQFSTTTDVDQQGAPDRFQLHQNYPNPFNPSTTFTFQIISPGLVTLKIFDSLGREVATPVNEMLYPGGFSRTWNAAGLPSGIYYYQLRSAGRMETRALLLLK